MGVAYYLVLDDKEPGFETGVSGEAIARARDALNAITEKLGLKSLDELTSFGNLDAEFDVPEEDRETDTPWFEAEEGIEWVNTLYEYIELHRSAVNDPDGVLSDLDECGDVLERAAKIDAK